VNTSTQAVPNSEIPKNLDVKRMRDFIPLNPKNPSDAVGQYRLIFRFCSTNF
jgi:hypothetical protein